MMLLSSDVRLALACGPLTASELATRLRTRTERVAALCDRLVACQQLGYAEGRYHA